MQGLNPTDNSLSLVVDVDWADGLTRPNTNAYLYADGTLIAIGTDSNVGDDIITPIVPGQPTTEDDLSRGSQGLRDAFIGPLELSPDNDYQVVIGTNGQMPADMTQFTRFTPLNTEARLEPIDSVVRIADDRFDFEPGDDTPVGPAEEIPEALQVAFEDDGSNIVPWQFGDLPLITISEFAEEDGGTNSQINIYNAFTGEHDAIIDENTSVIGAAASRPITKVVPGSDPERYYNVIAIERPNTGATTTDNNTNTVYAIDVEGRLSNLGNTGIVTYENFNNNDADPATNSNRVDTDQGMRFKSLAYYNDTNSERNFLYGVADRGFFDASQTGEDGNGVDQIRQSAGILSGNDMIYLLNPDTGAAIGRRGRNMPGGFESADPQAFSLRDNFGGNNNQYFPSETPWAGTNVVAQVQVPETVTSIVTDVNGGQSLFAFTTSGQVYQTAIVENAGGLYGAGDLMGAPAAIGTITDSDGNTLVFDQVTKGPANFSDVNDVVGLSNLYFGIGQANGTGPSRYYAFDLTTRVARPVFEFGADRVLVDDTLAGSSVAGMFFSSLDKNLWHTSDTLATAAGHGMGALDDRASVDGGGSLRFGFDVLDDDHSHLDFTGIFDNTLDAEDLQGIQGYNALGGAHGAVQSNSLDLSGFSAGDLPTLYFTYLLDSENVNARDNNDNPANFSDANLDNVMRDSFRVSVAGSDGIWRLVATNNIDDSLNNRIWEDTRDSVIHEYDPQGSNDYTDVESQRFVQELFDDDVFRQARIDLGPWAGDEDVRIRFEFNTAGEARPDQSEVHASRGERIADGHVLTLAGQMPNRLATLQSAATLPTLTKTFEFDHGLVVRMPSGSQVAAAGSIVLQRPGGGTIVELKTGAAAGSQVSVLATDTAAEVAQKVKSFIGAAAVGSPSNPAWVGFTAETTTGTYTFTGINNHILATPGLATSTRIPISIDISMTETEVRDAIQLAFANEIFYADAAPSLAAFPIVDGTNGVRVYDLSLSQSSFADPLLLISGEDGAGSNMPGSGFGVYQGAASVTTLLRAGERSRGLGGSNGVYLDDIVIGLAERGESFTGGDQGTALVDNPYFEARKYFSNTDSVRPFRQEPTTGEYQVEIRLGREYLGPDNEGKDARIQLNERLADAYSLQVDSDGSNIVDGDTFDLSNGFETLTFEFNDVTVAALTTPTTPGNVAINYRNTDTRGEIADVIRDAINSGSVRTVLNAEATSQSGTLNDSTDPVVVIHGYLAQDHLGETLFDATRIASIAETPFDNSSQLMAQDVNGAPWSLTTNGNIFFDDTIPHITINGTGDNTIDFYGFSVAEAGAFGLFDIDGAGAGLQLNLFDSSFNFLEKNEGIGGFFPDPGSFSTDDPALFFSFPNPGDYYLGVTRDDASLLGRAIPAGTSYTLHMSLENKSRYFTSVVTGQDVVLGEDNGDQNLRRDQGVFIVDSNIVSFSAGTAIEVSAGNDQPGVKVPNEGNRPKPGAVQHLSTLSTEKLIAGAVVQNNLLISNGDGIVPVG